MDGARGEGVAEAADEQANQAAHQELLVANGAGYHQDNAEDEPDHADRFQEVSAQLNHLAALPVNPGDGVVDSNLVGAEPSCRRSRSRPR